MKKTTIAISAMLLSSSLFAADASQATKAQVATASSVDMTKVSYLLGRGMGDQLKKGNISIDQASFDKGLEGALAGKKSDISAKDAQTIMMAFQKEVSEKMQQAGKKQAAANQLASDDFQKAIEKIDSIKKVSDGVYIQTLKAGDGQQPTSADTVTVNYRGTTPSQAYAKDNAGSLKTIQEGNLIGNEFDSSYSRGEPATFPLSNVVKCWQQAIPQMKVGGKAIIYCSPSVAYGAQDMPGIGPNQLLSFQVELLKVASK